MKIFIRHPTTNLVERNYIHDVLLRQFLGCDVTTLAEDRRDIEISLHGRALTRKITLPDVLLSVDDESWLRETSLPPSRLPLWTDKPDLEASNVSWPLPILYGKPLDTGGYFSRHDNGIDLGIDVFGSAFFMLTRYEELVVRKRDEHDRFAAQSSVALREGFLDRPLVDEYVEILWACMKQLWPQLERKQYNYQFLLSCDVDHPSSNTHGSLFRAARSAVGDIVRGRGLKMATGRLGVALRNARGDYSMDPHNTFDFMMNTAERHGLKVAFYFIAGHSGGAIDGDYTLDMPWIRKLMKQIYERGHEIGLHPSFNTYLDGEQLQTEFSNLLRVADEVGVKQDVWGGRQHYLRWEAPTTWRLWADAGLNYDSTVGFADHVGFRCGTCREFPVFDLENRRTLSLVERPLIVMEGTLLGAQYMNVGYDETLGWIDRLSTTCKRHGGNFTLLWHNSMLLTPDLKRLFRDAAMIAS